MPYLFYTIIVALLTSSLLSGQGFSGFVKDAATLEPLVGATVYIASEGTGTTTNASGYFSINTGKTDRAPKLVSVSYVGYQTIDTLLQEIGNHHSILIEPIFTNVLTGKVEIRANRSYRGQSLSTLRIPVSELNSVVSLFGEADPIKALSLFPGVAIGAEGTSGLYVRGGTPDQNLILFDGARVYNTSHLYGLLSPFNPDVLKTVDLYKDGFPARFGGRLSSVIDIVGLEGNKTKHSQDLTLGLINSRLTLQGPLQKGKTSYLAAGRFANLGLFTLLSKAQYNANRRNDYQSYDFYDVNGKIHHQGKNGIFALSFYSGQDRWNIAERVSEEESKTGIKWGNTTLSGSYKRPLGTSTFLNVSATYNKYRYAIDQIQSLPETDTTLRQVESFSYVEEVNAKIDVSRSLGKNLSARVGIEGGSMEVQPRELSFFGDFSVPEGILTGQPNEVAQLGAYAEAEYAMAKWQFDLGLRYSQFFTSFSRYRFLEPRLAVNYSVSPSSTFRFTYTEMNQPLHLLGTTSIGVPSDIWVAATDRVSPQWGNQASVGYERELSARWLVASQIFTKNYRDLIDFRRGVNFFMPFEGVWEDLVVTGGSGRSYGGELLLRLQGGRLNGWLSYTLSKSEVRFNSINGGSWYNRRYDRPHDFSLTAFYQLSKSWKLSGNFIYQSGYMTTMPEAAYLDIDGETTLFHYGDRNNFRTPAYNRVDLSATKSWQTYRGSPVSLSVGVYNVLLKRNPYYIQPQFGGSLQRDPADGSYSLLSVDPRIVQKSFLNFLPYVSYSRSF